MICQLIIAGSAYAQQTATSKNIQVNNDKYIVHKIVKGETIFSICKKYNIEQKELLDANPSLSNGLKTGFELNIPKKEGKKKSNEKKENDFISHTVKKKETLTSISKQYKISAEAIERFNPGVKSGVKIGQVLQIPVNEPKGLDKEQVKGNDDSLVKDCVDYEVEEGDTFLGLLRKFSITKEQLLKANPGIQTDIKVGQVVKIPKIAPGSNSAKSKNIEHIVEKGETIYGLAAEYNVKVFEIMELNPKLEDSGLLVGATILIPKISAGQPENITKKEDKPEAKVLKGNPIPKARQTVALARDTFQITMFLPLFLNENMSRNLSGSDNEGSTDSILVTDNLTRKERSLKSDSRKFLSFYEGFLIALDTMKKTGINIQVDLYDNQSRQTVVDSVMRRSKLLDADLIVGPIDVRHQKNISGYSYKNQIPLVSPFSSDDDYVKSNPYYFQINPTKDYIYRKTADYIGREYWNKNVIVLTPYNFEQLAGGDIVELVRERVRLNSLNHNDNSIQFSKVSIGEGYWEIKDNLKKDVENVVFILPPSNKTEREAILSRAINNLNILVSDFNITLIGMSEYAGYRSINTEYFHRLKLHYLTPNFVDYKDPEVASFIGNYRAKFLTEPNQYSYRGYDVAKFFLEAYRTNGRSYINKISSLKINTLQSNFKLMRVKDFSGFINRSLFVVNYTPEFDVKVDSIISD